MSQRPRSEGLRITKVGVWFAVFAFIVGLAATNTGNNGLYLVLALMGGALVVSHFAAARNLKGLELELAPAPEIFANRLSRLGLVVRNGSRWWPRSLLVARMTPGDFAEDLSRRDVDVTPLLITALEPRGAHDGRLELMFRRRGRYRLRSLRVSSVFPLGLFHKGMRYSEDQEILVFPQLFSPVSRRPSQLGKHGDESSRRIGWGHDLLSLRAYRPGDDPRGIHWKQSARTGELVLKERESEENRRLRIVFDNAVGSLDGKAEERRFEHLVSEAATAALDYLNQGYEVSLVTRGTRLGFATGGHHRFAILEALALVQPVDKTPKKIQLSEAQVPQLRLSMEGSVLEDIAVPKSRGGFAKPAKKVVSAAAAQGAGLS